MRLRAGTHDFLPVPCLSHQTTLGAGALLEGTRLALRIFDKKSRLRLEPSSEKKPRDSRGFFLGDARELRAA